MPNPFDALDAGLCAAVEGTFGEEAMLQPRLAASQYSAITADPDRPPRQVRGVFSSGSAVSGLEGAGVASGRTGSTTIAGQTPVFWLSPATIASLGYRIRAGDGLTLTGPPARTFRISRVDPTDTGDLELVLTEE